MNSHLQNTMFYDFITETLSRDRLSDDLILKICDYMLEGNLFVRYGHIPKNFSYEEKLKFTPDKLDWDMEYGNNTNLCQLYLHSLEPVKYLLQGYEVSKNIQYLNLASKLIKSWYIFANSKNENNSYLEKFKSWLKYRKTKKTNSFVWYDHCVSDRTLYFIYFLEIIKKANINHYEKEIENIHSLLKRHAHFLYDDENYTTQNHGTMIDRSLYLLSRYIFDKEAENWRNKALSRLREAFKRDFSTNMVNLENSSEYHLFNFDLFVMIEKSLLNRFNDSLGDDFQNLIDRGVDYMIHLSKPDLVFPLIGDGSKSSLKSLKTHPSFKYINKHESLKYVLSNGREGICPNELMKVYPNEGYAFFRNSWDYANNKNNISYASFIAGYTLKNHKHGDDLSFTYYAKGRDIFVDCGTFTYQPGEFRRHFMSAVSHNTVVVNGVTYPFIQGDPKNTGILDYGENNEYCYVIGKNDMYQGVNITRSFYFLNSGNIIIIDDIHSNSIKTYSQLFHLSHKINTNNIIHDNSNIQIIEEDIIISIKQINETNLFIHRGNKSTPTYGLVSERFNSLHESTTLEFQIKGKSTRFITLISVREKDKIISHFNAEFNENRLDIFEGDINFSIPLITYNRNSEENIYLIQKKIDDKKYKFTIIGAKPNFEFAWYVLRNNERIDTIWYTDNPHLEYQFSEPGVYEIHYFIRDKVNQEDKVRFIYENKINVQ